MRTNTIVIGRGNSTVVVSVVEMHEILEKQNKIRLARLASYDNVIIHDLTNYDAEKCFNGGNYSFTETYVIDSVSKTAMVFYDTSAEFNYCKINGCFCNNNCIDYCGPNPGHKRVTMEELDMIIKSFKNKYTKVSITFVEEDNELIIDVYSK